MLQTFCALKYKFISSLFKIYEKNQSADGFDEFHSDKWNGKIAAEVLPLFILPKFCIICFASIDCFWRTSHIKIKVFFLLFSLSVSKKSSVWPWNHSHFYCDLNINESLFLLFSDKAVDSFVIHEKKKTCKKHTRQTGCELKSGVNGRREEERSRPSCPKQPVPSWFTHSDMNRLLWNSGHCWWTGSSWSGLQSNLIS